MLYNKMNKMCSILFVYRSLTTKNVDRYVFYRKMSPPKIAGHWFLLLEPRFENSWRDLHMIKSIIMISFQYQVLLKLLICIGNILSTLKSL